MAKNEKTQEAKSGEVAADAKKAEKKATPKVEIIRGRMPAPVVLAIKSEPVEATDGALAAKYRTTNGKVSDIRKNRNFAYIKPETFVADQGDCDKTVAWAEQHGEAGMIEWAKSLQPGSADDRKAYDEDRIASRPGRKKKEVAEEPVAENTGGLVDEAPAPDADADLAELTK